MSSVSIDEAWGESNLLETRPTANTQIPITTHAVTARTATHTEEISDEQNAQSQRDEQMMTHFKDTYNAYEIMVYEIRLMRHEQTRRCTMYLAIVGVLFAMLFMYIDRLQQQIRILNSFMIHRQIPTLVGLNH